MIIGDDNDSKANSLCARIRAFRTRAFLRPSFSPSLTSTSYPYSSHSTCSLCRSQVDLAPLSQCCSSRDVAENIVHKLSAGFHRLLTMATASVVEIQIDHVCLIAWAKTEEEGIQDRSPSRS